MALFEVENGAVSRAEPVTFAAEEVRERQDLQKWLLENPSTLGEDLLVIAEEYGSWEDSRRRIDLLALDQQGNLVVIELKRTDSGGHMDLQGIRYAAMVSAMTFEDVVRAHQSFLNRRGSEEDARERISSFLGLASEDSFELSSVPRIILVSADFSLEITTTALWLVERGVDIRCIRCVPYKIGGRLVLDVQQLLPLQEASGYQVKIRQKDENVRLSLATTGKHRERTIPALMRNNVIDVGTDIEIVPMALPSRRTSQDVGIFRARIVDPESRDSVEWHHDGERYSPTALMRKLWDEHGVQKLMNNIFVHWRVVGSTQSMWDHAESLTRGERITGTGE